MQPKLGILVIHGMGSQLPDYANEMIAQIDKNITKRGFAPGDVCWEPVYWANILGPREDKLWNDLSSTVDMDYVRLRKFVLSAFGDAIAYQRVPGGMNDDVYELLHARVRLHLNRLRQKMGADLPVVVIAHSLGCAIMSDYIWDRQQEASGVPAGAKATERLDNLAGFLTFGCNLPLFSLAYNPVVSIQFPGVTLPDRFRPAAAWYNFFDPDDVLGYPLKPLSPSYNLAVNQDISINAGGIFSSWNPLSHSAYWDDGDFTGPAADLIANLLQANA